MNPDQFWIVLIALGVFVAVGEWRYRRRRRRRAERLAGDPLFELEMQVEQQDKIVAALESQKARMGVFTPQELLDELERQHAELRRLKGEHAALERTRQQ
jgi:cbb3-type cytochrome oxidase subunit 3